MSTEKYLSRSVSGQRGFIVEIGDNQDSKTKSYAEARIYSGFLGHVLEIENVQAFTTEDSQKVIDLANKFLAGEIRAKPDVFSLLFPLNDLDAELQTRCKIKKSLELGTQGEMEISEMNFHAYSSLRDHYNQSAGGTLSDLDSITLNGIKTALNDQGARLFVLKDKGQPSILLLEDATRSFSILDIKPSKKSYASALSLADRLSGESENFFITVKRSQEGLMQEISALEQQCEREEQLSLPRSKYANFEEELTKLPKVFVQNSYGPTFGIDY